MIVSMTGFVNTTITVNRTPGETVQLNVMLKSLNARFFEVTCKIPFAITHLETDMIKCLRKILLRGTIYLTITTVSGNLRTTAAPAYHVIANYLEALTAIQQRFHITGMLTISDIIQLPNIFELSEELLDEHAKKVIVDSIQLLANELMTIRIAEGKVLQKDITARITTIHTILKELKKQAEVLAHTRQSHLKTQATTLIHETAPEIKTQQLQILQAQLDKCDVSEELVRFTAHLENLTLILNDPEIETGKKIDFTVQELFREINTLAAKSNDAPMSSMAIAIKVELEKIREQTQNIV